MTLFCLKISFVFLKNTIKELKNNLAFFSYRFFLIQVSHVFQYIVVGNYKGEKTLNL